MIEKYRLESMNATVGHKKAWRIYEYDPEAIYNFEQEDYDEGNY